MESVRTIPTLKFEDYIVVWIAPLEIEAQAACYMLDKRHPGRFTTRPGCEYIFIPGEISGCNVVIATFPAGHNYGVGAAAALASQVKNTFPNIRFGLLVGIAAGLPNLSKHPPRDIRLGDVLVGLGQGESAGLISYGCGRETSTGFELSHRGAPAKTEMIVSSAIGNIKLLAPVEGNSFLIHYENMRHREHNNGTFQDPGQENDKLFRIVSEDGGETTQLVQRTQREKASRTKVWYGSIGSGDKLMKSAVERDKLRDTFDLIGLEMEAAGTISTIPVGVIRGVCDYADAQKNDEWQPYAAAMAAAYAKEVICTINPEDHRVNSLVTHNLTVGVAQNVTTTRNESAMTPQPSSDLLSTLPVYSNDNFSGREDELCKIARILDNSAPLKQRICLHGLGAIGKSQIAFEYAQRCSDRRSTFWVKADTWEHIESGYLAIAQRLIPGFRHVTRANTFSMVKQYLERSTTKSWTLVFDQADEKELFWGNPDGVNLINFIPSTAHGQVVITTRDSRFVGLASGQVVPAANGLKIEKMTLADGYSLSQKNLQPDLQWDVLDKTGQLFLEMLGGLPLAIVQATSYMREEFVPVEEFVQLYKEYELHGHLFDQYTPGIELEQKSVLYTWDISYIRIAAQPSSPGKSDSALLLDLLGFIDSRDSPLRELSDVEYLFQDQNGPNPAEGMEFLLEAQKKPSSLLWSVFSKRFGNKSKRDFHTAVTKLRNYSLVICAGCLVHPVVHSWISHRLKDDERTQYTHWLADEILLQYENAMPTEDSSDNWHYALLPFKYRWVTMGELTPFRHAQILLKHSKEHLDTTAMIPSSVYTLGQLLYRTGIIAASMGKTEKAVSYLDRAVSTLERYNSLSSCEWRIEVCKVRSRIVPPLQAIVEARNSLGDVPTYEATLWLAQCLQRGEECQEALELYDNIIVSSLEDFWVDSAGRKEFIAAAFGAAQILAAKPDFSSKSRARNLIDNTLIPFLDTLPHEHFLQSTLRSEILITRVEASDGDRPSAVQAVLDHYTLHPGSTLTGGNPNEWFEIINTFWVKKKWVMLETLGLAFLTKQHTLHVLVNFRRRLGDDSHKLLAFLSDIEMWCKIHYRVGRVCFELSKFAEASTMHWSALGLWTLFIEHRGRSFQSNVWALHRALSRHNPQRVASMRALERWYGEQLSMEMSLREGGEDVVAPALNFQ